MAVTLIFTVIRSLRLENAPMFLFRFSDFNLPKIGKYNIADATGHYRICSRPVDDNARLSNLLLTMLERVDVKTDKFQDSVRPLSELVA